MEWLESCVDDGMLDVLDWFIQQPVANVNTRLTLNKPDSKLAKYGDEWKAYRDFFPTVKDFQDDISKNQLLCYYEMMYMYVEAVDWVMGS